MNLRSQNSDQHGFTLLEVLIAIAVMVFISLGIFQMTTETYRLREILSSEGDFYNSVRFSMDILQRDIALLFSPTAILPAKPTVPIGAPPPVLSDSKEMQAIGSSDLGQSTLFWLPVPDKDGLRPSHFIGTDTKMTFISLSHMRIYKDSPESEFAKVTYELRKDEGNRDVPDGLVLVKIENSDAFNSEDKTEGPFIRTYPLLHGITKFRYRYYRKDRDQWNSSWDNEKEDQKNIFPDIVEIELSVHGPLRLSFDGKYRFRPEVPLRGLDPSS